jgi:hypothetical protein
MMASQLEFELKVSKDELSKSLKQSIKDAFDLEGALTTAIGVFGGNLFTKAFDAIGDGFRETIQFAKESVKAYSEQEDALNRLSQALRAAGSFSDGAMDDFSAFASTMQKASKYGDEVVISQIAVAKSFGSTNAGAKDLVQAAANLAATFGGSLEENVTKLGKTLSGTTGRLAQYIPELKNLTTEQLAAGEAARIVNEKFGGAAANELNTYSGRVVSLSNAYSDMQEEIGGVIANAALLKDAQSALGGIISQVTQAIADYRVEQQRQQNGFQETESSVEQLGRSYEELTQKVESLEQKGKQLPGGLDNFDTAKLKIFRDELTALETQVNNGAIEAKVNDMKAAMANGPDKGPEVPQEVLDARAKMNAEILNLEQQRILEENNLDMEADNAKIVNDQARQQAEIQRILDFNMTKSELEFQMKEAQLATMQEGADKELAIKKLNDEKELAQMKIKNDALIKQANVTRDAEKKASAERIALQQQTATVITGIVGVSANIASVLTKNGSKEQFYIQKAAALSQAGVAMWLAMAQANALPPPANAPALVAAKVNGAVALSGIAATTLQGFATGGVIGDSNGASMGGDNRVVSVRDGEMVLTADQQKVVFDALNTGNFGNQPIIIQIDGVEVFKAVRNQVKKGYKL